MHAYIQSLKPVLLKPPELTHSFLEAAHTQEADYRPHIQCADKSAILPLFRYQDSWSCDYDLESHTKMMDKIQPSALGLKGQFYGNVLFQITR